MNIRAALNKLKLAAKAIRHETTALLLAYKQHDIPWLAKVITIIAVGYALSPIDLIPDFIPVLGYLDDVILLPMILALAIRLIPPEVMAQCRIEAARIDEEDLPVNRAAGFMIILLWAALFGAIVFKVMK